MIQSGLVYAAPRQNELESSENVCMKIYSCYYTTEQKLHWNLKMEIVLC